MCNAFFEWGLIHTYRRNRMEAQKLKLLSIFRAAVRAKDKAEMNLSTSRISSSSDTNSLVSRIMSPEEKPFKDSCLTPSDSEQQQTNDIDFDLVRDHCLKYELFYQLMTPEFHMLVRRWRAIQNRTLTILAISLLRIRTLFSVQSLRLWKSVRFRHTILTMKKFLTEDQSISTTGGMSLPKYFVLLS